MAYLPCGKPGAERLCHAGRVVKPRPRLGELHQEATLDASACGEIVITLYYVFPWDIMELPHVEYLGQLWSLNHLHTQKTILVSDSY